VVLDLDVYPLWAPEAGRVEGAMTELVVSKMGIESILDRLGFRQDDKARLRAQLREARRDVEESRALLLRERGASDYWCWVADNEALAAETLRRANEALSLKLAEVVCNETDAALALDRARALLEQTEATVARQLADIAVLREAYRRELASNGQLRADLAQAQLDLDDYRRWQES
jgi:multidrug resistance efflux pump